MSVHLLEKTYGVTADQLADLPHLLRQRDPTDGCDAGADRQTTPLDLSLARYGAASCAQPMCGRACAEMRAAQPAEAAPNHFGGKKSWIVLGVAHDVRSAHKQLPYRTVSTYLQRSRPVGSRW